MKNDLSFESRKREWRLPVILVALVCAIALVYVVTFVVMLWPVKL